jgi:hypothetical protein
VLAITKQALHTSTGFEEAWIFFPWTNARPDFHGLFPRLEQVEASSLPPYTRVMIIVYITAGLGETNFAHFALVFSRRYTLSMIIQSVFEALHTFKSSQSSLHNHG